MRKHRFDNTHASAVLVATLWSVDLLSHEVKVAVRHLFRPSDEDGDLPGLGLAGIFHAALALVARQAGLFGAPEAQRLVTVEIERAAVAVEFLARRAKAGMGLGIVMKIRGGIVLPCLAIIGLLVFLGAGAVALDVGKAWVAFAEAEIG